MNFSIPPKEVAQIHLILSTLPLPPLPIKVSICSNDIELSDIKQAFDIATCEIIKTAETEDKVINTHALIASMMLCHKWTKYGNNTVTAQNIKSAQEKIVLELMQTILDFEATRVECKDHTLAIYNIFLHASVKWIQNYAPHGAVINIESADISTIYNEHNLHVAISHYSYSQGVLYSDKVSNLKCKVHDELCQEYIRMLHAEEKDEQCDESIRMDKKSVREECMEIAELYSKFSFEKLMILSYTRILQVVFFYSDIIFCIPTRRRLTLIY